MKRAKRYTGRGFEAATSTNPIRYSYGGEMGSTGI